MRSKIPTGLVVPFLLLCARHAWSADASGAQIDKDALAVAKGDGGFAFDFYARLHSDKPSNVFFSPYSISTAFAMVSAGAAGQTQAEISKSLRLLAPESKLHPGVSALAKLLETDDAKGGFQLRIANRLWGQTGFHVLPEFLRVTKTYYGAELAQVDFKQAESARGAINAWVDQQTDHKIPDLLAPGMVGPSTRLVLTNAVYFKARWTHEFQKSATTFNVFYPPGGQRVKVPFMHQTHRLRYAAINEARLLELPYGGDERLSMVIVLPEKSDGLADLEQRLTFDALQGWIAELKPRTVKVHLPKFKFTTELNLTETLKSMLVTLAFSNQADFSRISSDEKLFISAAIHKAYVDVNEEGTEAAAATAIGMRATAALPSPEEPVEFRADHSFVFLIRDNRTQTVLFVGRLANPRT